MCPHERLNFGALCSKAGRLKISPFSTGAEKLLSTSKDTETLDPNRLPRHVAVIMDGNGRWAKKHGVTRLRGHEAGAKAVRAIVEACGELERIETLTLYAFSTENWRRSQAEITGLFRLLSKYVRLELDNLHAEDIRVQFIGRTKGLPKKVLADLEESRELTKNNKSMQVNFAVNYGARAEIVDACRSIADDVKTGRLQSKKIDERQIAKRLYDPASADLDLLIRTAGETRLSNFMLWQASYAEIVVTRTLWPDFRNRHLLRAIKEFQSRTRRYGGRSRR